MPFIVLLLIKQYNKKTCHTKILVWRGQKTILAAKQNAGYSSSGLWMQQRWTVETNWPMVYTCGPCGEWTSLYFEPKLTIKPTRFMAHIWYVYLTYTHILGRILSFHFKITFKYVSSRGSHITHMLLIPKYLLNFVDDLPHDRSEVNQQSCT